ncbi:MAG: hypothetical protein ACOY46_12825 [Bacillota bacterium]
MINLPLFKWEIRRYAVVYGLFLLFTLAGFVALLFFMPFSGNWEEHPFFHVGFIMALFWGAGIFTREIRQGTIMEFLIARPVSREQFFNTVILAEALPIVLIMFLPFIYAAALSPWIEFDLSLIRLFFIDALAATWVFTVFLLGISLGQFLVSRKNSRYGWAAQAFIFGVLTAVFMNLGNIMKEYYWANLSWLAANHPFISGAVSLAVAYALYRLGLYRLKRIDI